MTLETPGRIVRLSVTFGTRGEPEDARKRIEALIARFISKTEEPDADGWETFPLFFTAHPLAQLEE